MGSKTVGAGLYGNPPIKLPPPYQCIASLPDGSQVFVSECDEMLSKPKVSEYDNKQVSSFVFSQRTQSYSLH